MQKTTVKHVHLVRVYIEKQWKNLFCVNDPLKSIGSNIHFLLIKLNYELEFALCTENK